MSVRHRGVAKAIVIVILAAIVGASFLLMTQEQKARASASDANQSLQAKITAGESLTPEEVHQLIGRQPHVSRKPGKHRMVEEYRWKGPMGQQVVYAYYTTAATQLLEAVSLNQKFDDWEGDDQ